MRRAETGLSPHATFGSHGKIDYIMGFKGMSQEDVDHHIMPIFMEAESKVFGNATKKAEVASSVVLGPWCGWKILASHSFLRSVVGSKMASSTEQQRSWQ